MQGNNVSVASRDLQALLVGSTLVARWFCRRTISMHEGRKRTWCRMSAGYCEIFDRNCGAIVYFRGRWRYTELILGPLRGIPHERSDRPTGLSFIPEWQKQVPMPYFKVVHASVNWTQKRASEITPDFLNIFQSADFERSMASSEIVNELFRLD